MSHLKKTTEETEISSWKLVYDRFKPAQEGLREALCTLGNGYFATRGADPESSASRIHYPGTYIAGVYNKLETFLAGRTISNEDLVNCPDWTLLKFRIGKSDWLIPSMNKILFYHKELNMRRGILTRKVLVEDRKGRRTTIETQRIVHMQDPHYAAIRYVIIPENYEDWIIIRSALDGTVQNTGVARYRQLNSKHLKAGSLGDLAKNGIYLSMRTNQSNIEIAEASKIRISVNGRDVKTPSRIVTKEKKGICQEFGIYVTKSRRYEIEKIVSIYTSKDKGVRNPVTAAIKSVKGAQDFDTLFKTHKHIWDTLWKRFDIEIEGDTFSQKALRVHIFHLLQTASAHNINIDAGLPARGLHGEAYRGHVFWDELFVMPFFGLHAPEISKALLMYRYRRIGKAREYARKNGYKGSMFPWQSGSTGVEETQVMHLNPLSGKWGSDSSRIQRHVSFAIAYNVWHYWEKTNDMDFLIHYGAEILLSIAQFGASLSKLNPKDGRYHTEGLMGPDEFHEKLPGSAKAGLKDNAYTNLLIVWTLLKALEVLDVLSKYHKTRLFKKIRLDEKQISLWEDITRKMNIIINDDGIISQFDGYFKLKELDWNAYRKKYGNVKRMDRILKAEGKSPNEYKLAKQADVLMIFYLLSLAELNDIFGRLGYKLDKNTLKKNYAYYIKRTSHGSTLSKVVHGYLSFLLGMSREAWQWFREILESDVYDTQGGTTPEGIHAGVMGGSLNIVVRDFAGINILEDRIKIRPSLPQAWKGLKLKFYYKGSWISLGIHPDHITVFIYGSKKKEFATPIDIQGKLHYLSFGERHSLSLKESKAMPNMEEI